MNEIAPDSITVLSTSIQCAVCGLQVPLDEAVIPETVDRLTYLCGLECYARWRATAAMSFPSLLRTPD